MSERVGAASASAASASASASSASASCARKRRAEDSGDALRPEKGDAGAEAAAEGGDEDEDDDGVEEDGPDGRAGVDQDGVRHIGLVLLGDEEDDDDDDDDDEEDDDDEDDDDEDYDNIDEDEGAGGASASAKGTASTGASASAGAGASGAGAGAGAGPSAAAASARARSSAPDVYRPGVDAPLGADESLEYDPSAYVMFHRLDVEWSCLSFDILPDRLGPARTKFPLQAFLVAGTQADRPSNNRLMVMRLSNLLKTHEKDEDVEDEDGDKDDEDEGSEGGQDDEPVLDVQKVPHSGGVNRVRVMPQEPHIVATWADTGRVHLWDVRSQLRILEANAAAAASGTGAGASVSSGAAASARSLAPVVTWAGHGGEGYALDWSRKAPGRLATGDCDGKIFVWDVDAGAAAAVLGPEASGIGSGAGASPAASSSSSSSSSAATASSADFGSVWKVDGSSPFQSHAGSVEDLQWSPNEASVFASCGVDGTVRIWDTRARAGGSKLAAAAHECDCNVIAWSTLVSYLLVSGADDGAFKIWDLRSFRAAAPIAYFTWHRKAITSVEWDPHDENALCVASSDNSVSVWDMSLEDDTEAELALTGGRGLPSSRDPRLADVPPQLLFVHQGQTDNKEAHFHRQLPGVIISTALDGLNVWKPDITTVT